MTELSDAAQRILNAGIAAAARSGDDNPEKYAQIDRAVAEAIGHLCLDDPGNGEVLAVDSLTEIVQLHLREKFAHAL